MTTFLASYVYYFPTEEEAENYKRRQDEEWDRRHAEYLRAHPEEIQEQAKPDAGSAMNKTAVIEKYRTAVRTFFTKSSPDPEYWLGRMGGLVVALPHAGLDAAEIEEIYDIAKEEGVSSYQREQEGLDATERPVPQAQVEMEGRD